MLTSSTDDGITFTKAIQMQNATYPYWKWIGFGPPGAIQLGQGKNKGRIIIPAYHDYLHSLDGTFTQGHLVISDDNG